MKIFKKIIAFALLATVCLTAFGAEAFATEETGTVKLNASIAPAKGGANAIVSMTFDDGHMPTAKTLNELMAQYGLKGSLMIKSDTVDDDTGHTVAEWNEIFKEGYLEPQSHSATHVDLRKEEYGTEDYEYEVVGSYEKLSAKFPEYDCLTFAIPNSAYPKGAQELYEKTYYAIRTGKSTSNAYTFGGAVQSLNPGFGLGAGSWHNLYMARLQPQGGTNAAGSVQNNLTYLSNCVNQGGWYISLTHAVTPVGEAYTGIHNDLYVNEAHEFFSQVAKYVAEGKVWCTTFSEATKYVRERQNAILNYYKNAEGHYLVDLTLKEMTEDNLPLPADVFNVPLTVKVEVPIGWQQVKYTQGTNVGTAKTFGEGGLNFAYVDIIPGGGTAEISNPSDSTKYVETLDIRQNLTVDSSIDFNVYIPADSYVDYVTVAGEVIEGVDAEELEGYKRYTISDIFVTEATAEFNFILNFKEDSYMDPYSFKCSVMSYLTALGKDTEATNAQKQLGYDFVSYAKGAYLKFLDDYNSKVELEESKLEPVTAPFDDALAAYEGFSRTQTQYGEAEDIGTLANVLSGVGFTLNEKPYYIFYVNEGFTGTLTATSGEYTATYEFSNGYYHCKTYAVFEVEAIYSLTDAVTVTASGEIDGTAVSAEGKYSLNNYVSGITDDMKDGKVPDYIDALYAYVQSAKSYIASLQPTE